LDPVKFRIVQLPSIWICEGAGLTKLPSITPPKSPTQSSAHAGRAPSSNSATLNSRILPIRLPPLLALFVLVEVIYASFRFTSDFVAMARDRSSPRVDWIPAVPPS
jgi:hypothetical protein